MIKVIFNLLFKVLFVLFIAISLSVIINLFLFKQISLLDSWSDRIEGKAYKEQIKLIDISLLEENIRKSSNMLLLDVRSSYEYNLAHIPGAQNLPIDKKIEYFPKFAERLFSNEMVVVYCANRECEDALNIAIFLKDTGVKNIFIFLGGWSEWAAKKRSIVKI